MALIAAVLAGSAAASERQIGHGPAWRVHAAAGWVAWDGIYDQDIIVQYLWHRGETGINWGRYYHALGSDQGGRATGLFTTCSGAGGAGTCRLRHRGLPDGTAQTIFTEPSGLRIRGYDEAGGRIAVGLAGGDRRGIYVRPPGGRLRRVSRTQPGRIARGSRVLVNAVARQGWRRVVGIDLAHPRRELLVAAGRYADTMDATVSGRHAYWLESKRRILRVDLTAPDPAIEAHVPVRKPTSFAVDRGWIYYARASGGVYEVRDPAWREIRLGLPIED